MGLEICVWALQCASVLQRVDQSGLAPKMQSNAHAKEAGCERIWIFRRSEESGVGCPSIFRQSATVRRFRGEESEKRSGY